MRSSSRTTSARIARRATALAIASGALCVQASAADTVRLRYGFKPDAAYEQALSLNLVMAIDPASTPAPLLALLQSMTGEVKQDVTSKARLQTKSRNADGSLPFAYKILEARGTMTQGGQTKPIPAMEQAASRPPAEGKLAADRRQIVLDPPAAGSEGLPKRVRERVADSLPVLPEKDLRVGESFETRTSMTLPGPSGKGERQAETIWVYKLKAVTPKEATFDVTQTLPAAATVPVTEGQKVEMTGGGKGSAVFNRETGTFSSIKVDLDLTMTMDLALPAGLAPGDGGTAAKPDGTNGSGAAPTRLKVLVKGPLVMSLVPAPPAS